MLGKFKGHFYMVRDHTGATHTRVVQSQADKIGMIALSSLGHIEYGFTGPAKELKEWATEHGFEYAYHNFTMMWDQRDAMPTIIS